MDEPEIPVFNAFQDDPAFGSLDLTGCFHSSFINPTIVIYFLITYFRNSWILKICSKQETKT